MGVSPWPATAARCWAVSRSVGETQSFRCLSWAMYDHVWLCPSALRMCLRVGSPGSLRATQGPVVPQGGCQGPAVAGSECVCARVPATGCIITVTLLSITSHWPGGRGPLPSAHTYTLRCPRQPRVGSTAKTPIRGSEGLREPGCRLSLMLARLQEEPPLCSFRGGGLVRVINRKSSRKPSL